MKPPAWPHTSQGPSARELMPAKTRSRKISLVARVAVSLLLLGYVFFAIDYRKLLTVAEDIQPMLFLASCVIAGVSVYLAAVRLHILMRPTVHDVPVPRLARINLIAHFYSLFLPSGIGIALATWYKVTGNRLGRLQFGLVIFLEKALFILTTLLFVAPALAFLSDERVAEIRQPAVLLSILLVGATFLAVLLLLLPPARRVLLAQPANGERHLAAMLAGFQIFLTQPRWLLLAFGMSILVQASIVLRMALLTLGTGVDLSWITLVWMLSLVFFLQNLPVSFVGIGVRESVLAYVFGLYGQPAEAGVLVGLLFFAQMLILGTIGGILEIIEPRSEVSHSDQRC